MDCSPKERVNTYILCCVCGWFFDLFHYYIVIFIVVLDQIYNCVG